MMKALYIFYFASLAIIFVLFALVIWYAYAVI